MKQIEKKLYQAPEASISALSLESLIATSPTIVGGGDNNQAGAPVVAESKSLIWDSSDNWDMD